MVSELIMSTRRERILLAVSVVLFIASGYLLSGEKYLGSVIFVSFGLITGSLLLKSVNNLNTAATSFFEALKNDDTTFRFPENTGNKTVSMLYSSMNQLKEHYHDIRMKNEYNETYYRNLLRNSSAGLIVINDSNHIELINIAASNFAGMSPESSNPDLLKIKHPSFFKAVCDIKPGENITYRNISAGNLQILSFKATNIRRHDVSLKLVSIHDIRNELEARELESYRKLMNVMTHEIMNLLTPLTTVAREISTMFERFDGENDPVQVDADTIKTAKSGLHLIDEHGEGLMNFVRNYRKISKVPQPQFEKFDASGWIDQLKIAFAGKMTENEIYFTVASEKTVNMLTADKKLLNQVLINIINNSIDAVMQIDAPRRIDLRLTRTSGDRVQIKICNNGPAIPAEIQDKIFVPFFTTKTNGSGIGLSISLEIVRLHHGSVSFVSTEGEMTCFTIEL
jgi:nitrogen fixation/metabolism regulation signal transduction histidine kinase